MAVVGSRVDPARTVDCEFEHAIWSGGEAVATLSIIQLVAKSRHKAKSNEGKRTHNPVSIRNTTGT